MTTAKEGDGMKIESILDAGLAWVRPDNPAEATTEEYVSLNVGDRDGQKTICGLTRPELREWSSHYLTKEKHTELWRYADSRPDDDGAAIFIVNSVQLERGFLTMEEMYGPRDTWNNAVREMAGLPVDQAPTDLLGIYKQSGIITESPNGVLLYYGHGPLEILTAADYWLSRHHQEFHLNSCTDYHWYMVSLAHHLYNDHAAAVKSYEENNPLVWGIKLAKGEYPFKPLPSPDEVKSVLANRLERSPMPSWVRPAPERNKQKGGRPSVDEQMVWMMKQVTMNGGRLTRKLVDEGNARFKETREHDSWKRQMQRYKKKYGIPDECKPN